MDKTKRMMDELCFVTITVVDWVDVFTRPMYKHILLDSLAYCQREKGLKIYAWVLMTNHLHAIVSSDGPFTVGEIIRDFKKFTSKKIIAALMANPQESRQEWMLHRFRFAGANDTPTKGFHFWQEDYHPECVATTDFFQQKLQYIHNNPVRQEYVARPEDYLYSSAVDYAGGKGLLDIVIAG